MPGTNCTAQTTHSVSSIKPQSNHHGANTREPLPFEHQKSTAMSCSLSYQFEDAQLTLAISLLKSKPEDIPVTDYINDLKRAIKNEDLKSERFVDSGEYWKSECEKLYQTNRNLNEEIRIASERRRLSEEQLRLANDRIRSLESGHNRPIGHSGKRKISLRDLVPAEDDLWAEDILHTPNDHVVITSYLFQITQERVSLEETPEDTFRVEEAAVSCRRLLRLLEDALSVCSMKFKSLKVADEDNTSITLLRYLFCEIARGYRTCFQTLDRSQRSIAGRNSKATANIPYLMCSFFNNILDYLHKFCKLHAESHQSHGNISIDNTHFIVTKLIAQMLVSIIHNIEWKAERSTHRDLLEGIISSIVDHAGILLSLGIFGEDIGGSNFPGNISNEAETKNYSGLISYESRYLVPILSAALDVEKEKKMITTRGVREKAMKKVQRALTKSTIGTNLATLRMPAKLTVDEAPLNIPELPHHKPYSTEWLIESLWVLVGWEVEE